MEIFGDFAASLFAEAEAASRVTAKILKSALRARRALMTLPPCFPVAPVIRRARDILSVVERLGEVGWMEWCVILLSEWNGVVF